MKFFAVVVLFFLMVSVGCVDEGVNSPVVVKEKRPDIKITSSNIKSSFSLSQGAIAEGTYTLTNYGDADGYITNSF